LSRVILDFAGPPALPLPFFRFYLVGCAQMIISGDSRNPFVAVRLGVLRVQYLALFNKHFFTKLLRYWSPVPMTFRHACMDPQLLSSPSLRPLAVHPSFGQLKVN